MERATASQPGAETAGGAKAAKSAKVAKIGKAARADTAVPDAHAEDKAADADDSDDAADADMDTAFFDEDAMHAFADEGEDGKGLDDNDSSESDLDDLDGKGLSVEDAKFDDFFKPAKAKGKASTARKDNANEKVGTFDVLDGKKDDDAEEGEDDAASDGDLEKALQSKVRELRDGGEDVGDDDGGDDDEDGEEEDEDMQEGEDGDASEGDLSETEKALEKKIQELKVAGKDVGDGAGDDDVEDEEGEADAALSKTKGKTLYEMDRKLQALEEEVAKLEEEQLEERHWSMRGEISAKQRPLNSLLEVHVDQPMTHFASRRAAAQAEAAGMGDEGDAAALEDVPGAEGLIKAAKFDIEAIIRQRVWNEDFDDVERKEVLPPSQRPKGEGDDFVETLNFEKSRVGLGDIYAKQYEAEMIGHKTDAQEKEDKEKTEAKALFAKVMYKLDQLTNAHFTPRPPMLGVSGEDLAKTSSIKMEETIPLMISDATLKAPEELRAPRRHDRERNELTHDERTALRRAKKTARKHKLEQRVESGELTLAGMRERHEKLSQKNAEAKKAKKEIGAVKDKGKKRLRASELLEQAAKNVLDPMSRKDEVRKERQVRPDGTPSAKRLKL